MADILKNNTKLSGEFFVAAELYRRGYKVGITLGNTETIDLLAEKNDKAIRIQVKSIQSKKSICWNISRDKVLNDVFFVLVNLNVDSFDKPEYYILSGEQIGQHLKKVESRRDYIDLNYVKKLDNVTENWSKLQ